MFSATSVSSSRCSEYVAAEDPWVAMSFKRRTGFDIDETVLPIVATIFLSFALSVTSATVMAASGRNSATAIAAQHVVSVLPTTSGTSTTISVEPSGRSVIS